MSELSHSHLESTHAPNKYIRLRAAELSQTPEWLSNIQTLLEHAS